jgi:branched-chain amino acid transport system permease protein
MDFFIQLLIGGLSVGFLYGLSAMGFVMIFKSSSVLNFAHGELLAIGAYFFLAFVTWAKLPILLSFLLALVGCFLLGIVIERGTPDLRHYADRRPGRDVQGADPARLGGKPLHIS